MPRDSYTDEELQRYFEDPEARRRAAAGDAVPPSEVKRRSGAILKWTLLGIAGVALAVGLWLVVLSFSLPPTELIENPEHLESTVAYTADGVELARYYLGQNRTWVTAEEISEEMTEALVALEDRRFYEHWGVDMRGWGAVAVGALTGQGIRGASTITMQLARNLYEQIGFERSVTRKVKEILTAIQLERRYTKDEIVEMYLNTVPWSYNAFGIEAAAQTYFNKPAAELDTEEAAVLVGMLKGPTRYNPVSNPERSQARRNVVMAAMVREGYLDRDRYEELKADSIALDFKPYSHTDNLAPHFAEILRAELKEWGQENGYDIYSDGLVVHTTIDSRVQQMAQEAVTEQANKLQSVVDVEWSGRRMPFFDKSRNAEDAYVRYAANNDIEPWSYFWDSQTRLVDAFVRDTDRWRALRRDGLEREEAVAQLRADEAFMDSLKAEKTRLEAGFVAVDPNTGYVRAWVGGRDYVADKFDHVKTARRQPGSTFKPFVYIAAIDNGYSPYYRLMDSTFVWEQPPLEPWIPANSGGSTGNYVTLRTALGQSKNIPTARLTKEIGPVTVATYARRLGVESPVEPVRSIGLGVSDVTLLEMVSAYATLADGGVYHEPQMITRIEDRQGNVIADFEPRGREALSASTAYTVVDMMREVIDAGTGSRIRWKYGLTEPDFAGKTGTTQESADGWFMLMHPDLVAGAWVGWNDRRLAFRTDWWGQGAHNALHIVGDFAQDLAGSDHPLASDLRRSRFEPPSGYVPPDAPPPPEDEDGRTPVQRLFDRWEDRQNQRRDDGERGRIGW
jgi:penicillin-binding protein 1A